jgi:type IV secretion system protein VirB3
MSQRNAGLTCDPLFVAATRPAMRWGVTYSALLANMVFVMEVFLLSRNLLALLLAAPLHGIAMLLCAKDARFFDLLLLSGRTRIAAVLGNQHFWKASSYSPLRLDLGRLHRRGASGWVEWLGPCAVRGRGVAKDSSPGTRASCAP